MKRQAKKSKTWERWAYLDPENNEVYVCEWWQSKMAAKKCSPPGVKIVRVSVCVISPPPTKERT